MKVAADHLGVFSGLPVDLLCELLLPMLSVKDVINLSCTSKAMRVICLEEPLWMSLCLANVKGNLTFKVRIDKDQSNKTPASITCIPHCMNVQQGSWRATAISDTAGSRANLPLLGLPMPVPGFSCEFLYR